MKTKKTGLLWAMLVLTCFTATAQKQQNNWYFGFNAGIDFNPAIPVALLNSSMSTNEGCTSYSNTSGGLLFYTNGNAVYNQLHQQMPNGYSLNGNSSTTQSALVVPKPGSSTQYYLFTLAASGSSNGLKYSIIDMSLDAGRGDVINKNTSLLQTSLTEKLAATYHSNGQDVWVAVHENNSNQFYAFLISLNGISSAITSSAGSAHTGSSSYNGSMKFSPSGNKLAAALYGNFQAEILDFNKTTGVFSNAITYTMPNAERPYGVEFSPNSGLLYVTNTDVNQVIIYQLNLNAGTPSAILSSSTPVYVRSYSSTIGSELQLGPDRKLYFSLYGNNYIGAIKYPDSLGSGCSATDSILFLNGGRTCRFGLPNYISGMVNHISISKNCSGDTTLFNYSNIYQLDSVSWDFGDPASGINNTSNLVNPSHYYTGTGIYNVTLIKYGWGGVADTITTQTVMYASPILTLGADTTVCATMTLDAGAGHTSYLWSGGSTTQNFTVINSGTYSVTVSNVYGCKSRDSIVVTVNPLPAVSIGRDTSLCGLSSYPLNAGNGFSNYLWSTNAVTQQITVFQSGIYTVTVTDGNGCKKSDTIQVAFHPLPYINLGPDVSACVHYTLNAGIGFSAYVWSTGSLSQSININASGPYWVYVTDNFLCSNRDTINVTVHPLPVVNLGNDTIICNGNTLTLDATPSFVNYTWNNGSTDSTLIVSTPGTYYVTVQDSFCSAADTVLVNTVTCTPVASVVASDTVICQSACINFTDMSVNGPTSWFWYFPNAIPDTSTAQNPTQICFAQPGNYSVTLIACNGGGCNTVFNPSFIQVGAPQSVSITLSNDTLYATPSNLTYAWHEFSQPSVTLSTNPYYVITQTGYYYAVATNSFGCTSTSNIMLITGVEDAQDNGIKIIYPGRGNDQLLISSAHVKKIKCIVYDTSGRMLMVKENNHGELTMPVNQLAEGVYILQLQTGKTTINKKFVLAH